MPKNAIDPYDKRSRYASVPTRVAPDRDGRPRAGKGLRPLLQPASRLEHVVEGGDRLDQLAYKYYRRSRQWWRVLDANPAIENPLELLGESPERSVVFAVTFTGPKPPWATLFRVLDAQPGVVR